MQRLDELAFAPDVPPYYDPANILHQSAMVMRNATALEKRREALEFMRPAALHSALNLSTSLEKFSDELAAHMQHGRTFCLTENINNVVMWSHYAEEHKGVGFKLRVLDDIDHPFLIAKPVTYSDAYICVGDRSEEHTSDLQSLMRISYAVFCLKKKKN